MTILGYVDTTIMIVILLLAFDALRRVTFFAQPLQTVAFVLICIGSFGIISYHLDGHEVQWWAIAMHSGIAIYEIRMFGTGVILRRGISMPRVGGIERRADMKATQIDH